MTRVVVVASLLGMSGLAAVALAFESTSQAAQPGTPATPLAFASDELVVDAPPSGPIGGISFSESPSDSDGWFGGLSLGARTDISPRFGVEADLDPPLLRQDGTPLRYEFAFALPGHRSGLGLDVGIASRTTLSRDEDGEISRASSGTELRIGQRLAQLVQPWEAPTWDAPTWYVFAAADGQAVTWRPEDAAGPSTDGVRWQDRVEVGDFQAGLSLEAGGVQASLSYVERDVNGWGASASENFTGVTLTWRR